MPRLTVSARLAALALALVVPLLAWSVPAQADPPKQTTLTLRADGDLEEDTTITLAANVSSYPRATGTFDYKDVDGNVIATGQALPGGGTYPVTVPKPSGPTTFTVDFHSDDPGWTDATATLNWVAMNIKTVIATPQPTIIKLNGLLPTITLTLAVSFKLKDGTGVPGVEIYNYMLCDPGPQRYCGLHVPICRAVSGPDGLATCKGAGTWGSLVSILGGDVIQTLYSDTVKPNRGYNYVWKPTQYPIIG